MTYQQKIKRMTKQTNPFVLYKFVTSVHIFPITFEIFYLSFLLLHE